MRDEDSPGAARPTKLSPSELLRRARALALRGRQVVEDLAQKVLERASATLAPERAQGSEAAGASAAEPSPSPRAEPSPSRPAEPSPASSAGPAVLEHDASERVAVVGSRFAAEADALFVGDLEPETLQQVDADLPELPATYGDHRVSLVARDPQWLYCSWDVPESSRAPLRQGHGQITLRLSDVTDLEFDGHNAWSEHRYPLTEDAREWYLPAPVPGRHYLAELGYELPDGRFVALGRSGAAAPLAAAPAPEPEEPLVFARVDPEGPLQPPAPRRDAPAPAERVPDPDVGSAVAPPPKAAADPGAAPSPRYRVEAAVPPREGSGVTAGPSAPGDEAAPPRWSGAPVGWSGAPAGWSGAPAGWSGAPAGWSGAPAGWSGAPAGGSGAPVGLVSDPQAPDARQITLHFARGAGSAAHRKDVDPQDDGR